MMRKLMLMGLFLTFLTMATAVFADEVVVTKNGKKYHKATCLLVKNKQDEKMDREKAIQSGYEPCKKCFKEETQADNQKENKKK